MPDVMLSKNNYFYTDNINVKIYTRRDATIRYTYDGSIPNESSLTYKPDTGIDMMRGSSNSPKIYTFRMVAFYDDGTTSDSFTQTDFVGLTVIARCSS